MLSLSWTAERPQRWCKARFELAPMSALTCDTAARNLQYQQGLMRQSWHNTETTLAKVPAVRINNGPQLRTRPQRPQRGVINGRLREVHVFHDNGPHARRIDRSADAVLFVAEGCRVQLHSHRS